MKWCIMFLLICMICRESRAQKPSPLDQKRSEIKLLRINEISNKFYLRKKDPARMEMYALFSTYFTENNIYPNEDAIDLIDAYNKEANYDDIKSKRANFKPLLLTPVKIDAQHRTMMQQNARQIKIFKIATATFNQKQEIVNAVADTFIPTNFKNALLTFRNTVLPRINNNAENIPALQMDFFLTSLNDINHLMDQLADTADHAGTRMAVTELMDDFSAYKAPVKLASPHQLPSALYHDHNANLFLAVAFMPYREDPLLLPDDTELPNANVYVYTRGADGKWDQQPKPNAYNVYYGANGLKYSLTAGCDTLSFFRYHPSVLASTLPVILAKGNYCFVLQDVTNNKIYLRPDINLRDNKVIDDQQLIKLCFKVEN